MDILGGGKKIFELTGYFQQLPFAGQFRLIFLWRLAILIPEVLAVSFYLSDESTSSLGDVDCTTEIHVIELMR
jgi:hypothetical protein